MNPQWKKFLWRIIFWICAETVLNLLNIDTLYDYNEFLLEQQIIGNHPEIVLFQDVAITTPAISPHFLKPPLRFHRFNIASL